MVKATGKAIQKNNGKSLFEQAIEELEDYFIEIKRGELYEFLLKTLGKPLIEKVLERTRGNQSKAAKILGIHRNTLYAKIKNLRIDPRVYKWKDG